MMDSVIEKACKIATDIRDCLYQTSFEVKFRTYHGIGSIDILRFKVDDVVWEIKYDHNKSFEDNLNYLVDDFRINKMEG